MSMACGHVFATALPIALPSAALAHEAAPIPTNSVTYQTWGDADAPAVMQMLGWMGTSHSWRKLAPPRRSRARLDLKGKRT
jgi:hypothetical protein